MMSSLISPSRRASNCTALRRITYSSISQCRSHSKLERHCHGTLVAGRKLSLLTRNKSTSSVPAVQAVASGFSPRDLFMKLIQEKDDQSDFLVNRPQSAFERIKNFPEGVKALVRDCLRCKAIYDTPLNSWRIEHPSGQLVHLGRIPRREYQQQRQLRKDFRTMFPLVLIWIPPIIGFLPPILAVMAPRQFMSSHFHNPFEIESFAQTEYGQRLQVYSDLAEMFWSSIQYGTIGTKTLQRSLAQVSEEDDAGPILDSLTLYKTVFARNDDSDVQMSGTKVAPGMFWSIRNLPREYLVNLSLAMGINQYLPGWIGPWVTDFQPSEWLESQVDRIARLVCYDDAMLIEEGHHLTNCNALTDDEVREACLMRGLPVTRATNADDRRLCLTNHLKMIAAVREDPSTKVRSDGFRLFTMHLAPLRQALKKSGTKIRYGSALN